MAETKYKKFYDFLWQNHGDLLKKFQGLAVGDANFDTVGRDVLDAVRDWERRLCSGQARGNFAKFGHKLAEKYWDLVRKDLPLIDQVGLKIS